MYEVVNFFTDLQDFNHPYNAGDIFPRNGLKVSKERLEELSGSNNRQNKPLIRRIKEDADNEPLPFSDDDIVLETDTKEKKYTKTGINRMTTTELRELADKVGIENAFKTSGGTLKKILIEHFNL